MSEINFVDTKDLIESVLLRSNDPEGERFFLVGRNGITKIDPYYEYGQMAGVPWLAVFVGEEIKFKFDAVNCVIAYFTSGDK